MTALDQAVYEKVYLEAMRLPADCRSRLGHVLLESVRADIDDDVEPGAEAAWNDAINQRIAEIDSGKVAGLTHDEVMSRIKARFTWER